MAGLQLILQAFCAPRPLAGILKTSCELRYKLLLLKNFLQQNFSQAFYEFLTYFLQTSHKLYSSFQQIFLGSLLQIFYKLHHTLLTNFSCLRTSYNILTYFLHTSHKLNTSFQQTLCKLLINFLQNSCKSFLQTSYKLLVPMSFLHYIFYNLFTNFLYTFHKFLPTL